MEHIVTGVRLNKDDLQNMRVEHCPKCTHLTLQAKIVSDSYHTCLGCGSLLKLEYVVKR